MGGNTPGRSRDEYFTTLGGRGNTTTRTSSARSLTEKTICRPAGRHQAGRTPSNDDDFPVFHAFIVA